MASRPSPNPNMGKGLEKAISMGMDLVRQAREAAKANAAPSREKQMAAEHRAALVRYDAEVRQYKGRLTGAKLGTFAGAAGAGLMGIAAIQAAAPPGSGIEGVYVAALAAGSGWLGWRARRRAKQLEAHPPVPQLPPLPPARMRTGARGAEQADRVANALMHLYDLVPNVGRLYPQAGQELWRAVSDVEPLLRGQVERLSSLDRIEVEMPGSSAARAAVQAGATVTARLREGADALEELTTAAVRMLAAPDVGDGVADTLAPAILGLEAYTHGLNAANAARLNGS